jgi:hypothetical protein
VALEGFSCGPRDGDGRLAAAASAGVFAALYVFAVGMVFPLPYELPESFPAPSSDIVWEGPPMQVPWLTVYLNRRWVVSVNPESVLTTAFLSVLVGLNAAAVTYAQRHTSCRLTRRTKLSNDRCSAGLFRVLLMLRQRLRFRSPDGVRGRLELDRRATGFQQAFCSCLANGAGGKPLPHMQTSRQHGFAETSYIFLSSCTNITAPITAMASPASVVRPNVLVKNSHDHPLIKAAPTSMRTRPVSVGPSTEISVGWARSDTPPLRGIRRLAIV